MSPAWGQNPVVTDDRLTLELIARQPDIVTPTGVAVDERGRVWVVENHTHHRPPTYSGPPTDRIRIFSDFDEHGRARKITTFAEGFRSSMSLALRPGGAVYLATRSDIHLLRDTDGDDVADQRKVIVQLRTRATYPHNALSGFAFDALGFMYFGLGENEGLDYELVGADGTSLKGGGEGGSIYRCKPDGTGLVRVATGFWNPFHMAVDAFGRLFAVDNDPDSRGPCRLLHIVQGGDYGYRYRNGRKGLHPFTAWNGELPGTLPMVSGTAEAPSGIVAYESTGLPKEYIGNLLVTSWGDHVIERFQLKPRGASFSATRQVLVRGGENFRPVGIATAPDGSLVISDWVDKSYPVHGRGRIWRLRMKNPPKDDGLRVSQVAAKDASAYFRMNAILAMRSLQSGKYLLPVLGDADPFLASAALYALGKSEQVPYLLANTQGADPRVRVGILLALRRAGTGEARKAVPAFLTDGDPEVRRAAIQWLAEEHLKEFEPLLEESVARPPVTRELFEALLAAREILSGRTRKPGDEWSGQDYIAPIVLDATRPATLRALGLRMLRPDHPLLTASVLRKLLESGDAGLRREAVRALALRTDEPSQALLRRLAGNEKAELGSRATAVLGLANSADASAATRRLLVSLLAEPALRREALRSLRGALADAEAHDVFSTAAKDTDSTADGRQEFAQQLLLLFGSAKGTAWQGRLKKLAEEAGPTPKTDADWRTALSGRGDAAAGERVFFHLRGPRCYVCHRIDGRGGAIGPDLSTIGRSTTRDKLIESILAPSKEIAPQFVTWRIVTSDGRIHTGAIVEEGPHSTVTLADTQGKLEVLNRNAIEDRQALPTSIMPEKLHELMTYQEFRDLLAYLEERK